MYQKNNFNEHLHKQIKNTSAVAYKTRLSVRFKTRLSVPLSMMACAFSPIPEMFQVRVAFTKLSLCRNLLSYFSSSHFILIALTEFKRFNILIYVQIA